VAVIDNTRDWTNGAKVVGLASKGTKALLVVGIHQCSPAGGKSQIGLQPIAQSDKAVSKPESTKGQ